MTVDQKTNKFSCSRLKGCYSDIEGIFDSLELCDNNCKQKTDEGTHKMFGCSKGKCKPMKYGKWDTMKECIKFDNICGDKSYNTNTNGTQDTTTLYTCSEGICFEDPNGMYTSLEDCVTDCLSTYVEYQPPEVTIMEQVLETPVDLDGIVKCSKGYYWCEVLNKCISNKTECPKKEDK